MKNTKIAAFAAQVANEIKAFLPEEYKDAVVSINEVQKNNTVLSGLNIRTEKVNVSPTIYLEQFYDKFQEGEEMEYILREIADVYLEHAMDHDFDISTITNWDKAKSHIVPRLVGTESNSDLLETRPHSLLADDLAVIYAVNLGEGAMGSMSVPITNELMKTWGVSAEELHELACENLPKILPSSFKGMNEVMSEMMLPRIMSEMGFMSGDESEAREFLEAMLPPEETMFVLSNIKKLNGASALLDGDMMDHISNEIGSNFFILPSSIHEVLIVPDNGEMSAEDLQAMVVDVNDTQVAPEDKLSDSVYYYSVDTGEITKTLVEAA